MLSRGTAGVRGRTLIINLPGSEKAVRESFAVIADQLEHAVEMMAGRRALGRILQAAHEQLERTHPSTASAATTVYLDHAATSWPKPGVVVDAVHEALTKYGGNPGRGAYALAVATGRMIAEARQACADLLRVPDSNDLFFLSGCTEGMNLALKGLLSPGDRVVACSTEHNAVARPLTWLASRGVVVDIVDADPTGLLDADAVERAVASAPTRAVVCQHASNVTGTIQHIGDIVDIAHQHGALAIVDGAQAGGHLDLDLPAIGADAYAVSGHKGLLGPQGIGLLYLAPGVDAEELVQGGTGSGASELPTQPTTRPDRYEAGTPNTPGIAGLGASAASLLRTGMPFAPRSVASRGVCTKACWRSKGFGCWVRARSSRACRWFRSPTSAWMRTRSRSCSTSSTASVRAPVFIARRGLIGLSAPWIAVP